MAKKPLASRGWHVHAPADSGERGNAHGPCRTSILQPHPAASSRGLILRSPALFPTLCSLLSPMTYAETDTLPSSPRAGSALPFVSSLQYGGFFGLTRAGVTIKICLAYLCSRN